METFDFEYRAASISDLNLRWDKNIENNADDSRWIEWKEQYIRDNKAGICKSFVIVCDNEPIGEGTLIFSSQHGAINGRTELADDKNVANINALRIEKQYESKGHISKLVKLMEQYAQSVGYKTLTIGVEAREARNLAIYLHWGYTMFIKSEVEDDALVLYYSKELI